MSRYAFKRVLVVHGLKRSGNHAIINWIAAQDSFRICNNVLPMRHVLEGKISVQSPPSFSQWAAERHIFPISVGSYLKNLFHAPQGLIVSVEDHEISLVPFIEGPVDITHVIILRDPVNMFASRIRKASLVSSPVYPGTYNHYIERIVSLWKDYARACLGEFESFDRKVCIYFNEWYRSTDYRKEISSALGLKFSESDIQNISHIGGGSSFDGIKYDQSELKMNVLNRSADLSDTERALLHRILQDDELIHLHNAVESRYGSSSAIQTTHF